MRPLGFGSRLSATTTLAGSDYRHNSQPPQSEALSSKQKTDSLSGLHASVRRIDGEAQNLQKSVAKLDKGHKTLALEIHRLTTTVETVVLAQTNIISRMEAIEATIVGLSAAVEAQAVAPSVAPELETARDNILKVFCPCFLYCIPFTNFSDAGRHPSHLF